VEVLLPLALWGIQPEREAPTPGSRKSGDGRSSDLPASLADMQQAWRRAPMGLAVRRSLFLHLAVGLQEYEIAAREGVTQQATSVRYRSGVFAILDYLNGGHRG
jgi:hypothetical protein